MADAPPAPDRVTVSAEPYPGGAGVWMTVQMATGRAQFLVPPEQAAALAASIVQVLGEQASRLARELSLWVSAG